MIDPDTIIGLLRGLHLAATESLLGTAGFIAWILPAAANVPDSLHLRLVRLGWISLLVALLAGMAWFAVQAASIAGADTPAEVLNALPVVAAHTRFGTLLMVRLGLLLAATLAALFAAAPGNQNSWPRAGIAVHLVLALTLIAVGLQGFIGHVGAAEGATGDGLVLSEALHLIAAGFWFGALPPLWFGVRALSAEQATSVCERFSPVALACVLILAGTGLAQGLQLIGSVPGLFGTPYGRLALLKISLFLLALILAGTNRLSLTDRLASGAASGRRLLLASVAVETILGLTIVIAAGFLASTVPAEHAEPVWPFAWQFSLVTVNEDAEFRREVIVSLLLIGAAVVLMAAAMLWRRLRLAAFAVLAVAIVLRGPSFTLLTVEAYPTSFQTSPTNFSAISIARGEVLFEQNCAVCHGPEGEGNGPAAAGLRIRPADLTTPHIWEHTDGEMFWWLTRGVDDPEGGLAMPGFGGSLSAEDRWAVIDYVRAHNAGMASLQEADFDVPVRAPVLPVACDGVTASTTADLLGHVVHVIVGDPPKNQPQVAPPADLPSITLIVPADEAADTRPEPGTCVAAGPAAWNAYAVLAGLPLDEVAGTEFLVDPNGWLRVVQRPGATGGWHTRNDLLAAIRDIRDHPIEQRQGGQHDHHH
jgi:putative copper export protein/mono/diheme cytochrome c family protein